MSLHVPAHHAGMAGERVLRDLLIAVVVIAVALAVLLALPLVKVDIGPGSLTDEQQSLIQYRADERASWAAGVPTEASSLIEYRAGERDSR